MAIIYHESSQTFHLFNGEISYVFMVLKNHQLGQLYFGKRIHDREDFSYLLELKDRPMSACVFEGDRTFSLEHIKQEYPAYGNGDMRYPAYTIAQENGSRISEFVYSGYTIKNGKPGIEQLPATYVEQENEAETLEVSLEDSVSGTRIVLRYTIFEDFPVITRNVRFEQNAAAKVSLERAMSLSLDLPDMDYEMVELAGAWARERYVEKRKLKHGIQAVYSLRGCSSANYNPFIALKRPETTERSGEVIGFSLIYSGNFLAQAEVDTYDTTRITIGIHPESFSWQLGKGDFFETPEAVMVYSENGLNGMSHVFHGLYQSRLVRGKWRDAQRPILINNWEATYFDFEESKILEIAECAKNLGIELFVLDDGWFGKRNNDTSSLGDWYVNLEKLPNGISGLARQIENMGMKFGLWIEPEMINKDSRLYREHPDWVLSVPNRRMSHGRNQYVLDFSREDVIDGIYGQLENIFKDAPISYVKWDMNRSMTEVYSQAAPPDEQGTIMHRYILGVYRLYEKLIARFPDILFESCASGGSRFDPGMLYYAPQCWTSDDTDAVERLKIQYGTSMVYPISSMGAHVSAAPNHQLHRNTSLSMRGNVACFGAFGYELDITKLTEEEKEMIKEQVSFMKRYRKLLQYGKFYRLASPFDGNVTAWMVVDKEQKTALVGYYRILQRVNDAYHKIKLQGLNKDYCYHVTVLDEKIYGDELMNIGLIVSDASSGENHEKYDGTNGDFQSRIYELTVVCDA